MKKALRFISFFLFFTGTCFSLQAQTVGQLYDMVYWGGTPPHVGEGTVNVFDPLTKKNSDIVDFIVSNGDEPYGNFIQTKDGMLWGMTPYGGLAAPPYGGVIFTYNVRTKTQTVVYQFNSYDTTMPSISYGTLLYVPNDSCFYALSSYGGIPGGGTIFKFNPRTKVCTKLVTMWGRTTGYYPTSNFIQVNDSILYATAQLWKGGLPGSILTYNIKSGVADTVHVFRGSPDGSTPRGGLIKATNGLLYGLTMYGGTANDGVLYSFDPTNLTETVLYNFGGPPNDGANPQEILLQAKDGFLYGTTAFGGDSNKGTLFKYDITSNTETVLFSFKITTGCNPYGDVMQASDGLLYGNTNLGGTDNFGTIFSYDPVGHIEKTLYSYNDTLGAFPYGDFLEVMSARDSVVNNKCPNDSSGSITIFERGGIPPLTYHWSNGATTSSITGLKYGIDTGTVTDSRGIAFTFIDTVGPAPMLVTFNVSNPCYGGGGGTASANVAGGLGPFTYTWSNGQTNDTATNLTTGTYTCSVTDVNGCKGMGSVTISQAAPLVIDSVHVTKQSCYYCHDGTITVYVSGGVPPGDTVCNHYLWSNSGFYTGYDSNTISGLDSGKYTVCVTSCYGCGSVCLDSNVTVLTGTKSLTNSVGTIIVYPNPNNGKFTIQWSVASGQWAAEIYNVLGEIVYSQFNMQHSTFDIDLSNQPEGIYILRINSSKAVLTKKIIIQK